MYISEEKTTILPITNDEVFKRLFGNTKVTRYFLNDILGLEITPQDSIVVKDREINLGKAKTKDTRLDIRVSTGETDVEIEMQCKNHASYGDRAMYYWAQMFWQSLQNGETYSKAHKCISLNILDFKTLTCQEGFSVFKPLEETRGELLSDKFTIAFLELPKKENLPDSLKAWADLILANTKEEVTKMADETNNPGIKEAADEVLEINREPWIKTLKEQLEEAAHERASFEETERLERE
ncbi:MAG: Rpn family recombination-promoting nuclease/putative transposase [Ruminococcus sp.]|nr:Rpn family recombination-promoting nuclease/putative transposase [Ruminococcus sp.]